MDTGVIIIIVVAGILLAAIITWIITKSAAAAAIIALQAKLSGTEQTANQLQKELQELLKKLESAHLLAGTLQQSNAGLAKQTEMLNEVSFEQKHTIQQRERELEEKQQLLTDALRAKTVAETMLSDSGKAISELQKRENNLKEETENLQRRLITIKEDNARLEADNRAVVERLLEQQEFVAGAQQSLKDAFGALSADALKNNNESFVALATATLEEKVTEAKGELAKKEQAIDQLVKPLSESLTKMDEKINALENKREGAYSQMSTLLDQMKQSTAALDKETRSLVSALKTSTTRGRYGEIALRRLVEFAGMLEHCDFEEQVSTETESGKLRPDMVVQLPGNRLIVVDSKVPLAAYLEVFETADNDAQKQLMDKHVAAVKTHLKQLGSKAYWDQFADAPDFVVLFMQIESSFGAALQVWPGMIEEALNNRIIIATPTTLITILRSIGYSWSQLSTIENIEAIRDAAVELYERSATLMEHMLNVGKGLSGTINHYNKAVGSLESSFLPQGRKINQLAQSFTKKPLPDMLPVEIAVREITSPAPEPAAADLFLDEERENK